MCPRRPLGSLIRRFMLSAANGSNFQLQRVSNELMSSQSVLQSEWQSSMYEEIFYDKKDGAFWDKETGVDLNIKTTPNCYGM